MESLWTERLVGSDPDEWCSSTPQSRRGSNDSSNGLSCTATVNGGMHDVAPPGQGGHVRATVGESGSAFKVWLDRWTAIGFYTGPRLPDEDVRGEQLLGLWGEPIPSGWAR